MYESEGYGKNPDSSFPLKWTRGYDTPESFTDRRREGVCEVRRKGLNGEVTVTPYFGYTFLPRSFKVFPYRTLLRDENLEVEDTRPPVSFFYTMGKSYLVIEDTRPIL